MNTIATRLPTVLIVAALAAVSVIGLGRSPALPQAAISLVVVDVTAVAKGYRAGKLIGSSVINDHNDKIGTLDDVVIGRDRVLFAILQVGGFLGLGGHLVAVPFQTLVLNDSGSKITLPGATKDELKKLPEFKYS